VRKVNRVEREDIPLRDRKYLDSFKDRVCEVCGYPESVACHIRLNHLGGMGTKPPDWAVIALCSRCHDEFDGRTEHDGGAMWLIEKWILPFCRARYDTWKYNNSWMTLKPR